MNKGEWNKQLEASMLELSNLHLAGAIKAIGCVLVLENNDIRTFLHHEDGERFTLTAGCNILNAQILDMCKNGSVNK